MRMTRFLKTKSLIIFESKKTKRPKQDSYFELKILRINIADKQWQCRNTDYWADDTLAD